MFGEEVFTSSITPSILAEDEYVSGPSEEESSELSPATEVEFYFFNRELVGVI